MTKPPSNLDIEIEELELLIHKTDPNDEEYTALVTHLNFLCEIRTKNQKTFWSRITPDTMVVAGVNLLGILLILNHERLHLVSSKALGFVTKLKP